MESNLINGKEDFLSVDKPIPGQNFVCMSFVSPETSLLQKSEFIFYRFLKNKLNLDYDFNKFKEEYQNFLDLNSKQIEEEFNEKKNFQTSTRGIKIRGSYDTQREADIRAKVLQKLDPSFNVFVGQVGYWLPWDPSADQISNQQYQEDQLNQLVTKYKENEVLKDKFYEKEKQDRIKACMEDNINNNMNSIQEIDESNDANNNYSIKNEKINTQTGEVSVEGILDSLTINDSHENIKKQFEEFKLEK